MLVGFTINTAVHADPFVADNLMAVPAGLMFVFAGLLMALPPEQKMANLAGDALDHLLCADLRLGRLCSRRTQVRWQHHGYLVHPGELLGRTFFGFFAVILDAFAIKMWMRQFRRGFGRSANAASLRVFLTRTGDRAA